MSRRARQRRDKRAEIPDEAALSRLMTKGAEAWRTVPDAAAWVDELRGNTMTDTTDQFQPLRDALAANTTPGPWKALNHSWSDTSILAPGFDHAVCRLDINHATEESQEADEALMAANAALIVAAVNAAPALLAEVERLRSALESPMQGGMSNDELREAWGKKLPGVEPKDNELTAFALGVEVGNVGRDCYFAERNSARDAWRERVKQCEALAAEVERKEASRLYAEQHAMRLLSERDEALATVERLTAELAAARVDADSMRQKLADVRASCATTVFVTALEAQEEDADDLGTQGWLDLAEERIRKGV